MNKMMKQPILVLASLCLMTNIAYGAKSSKRAAPRNTDVENIREKYWAHGEEEDVGVVQNRLYTKKSKVEVQPFLGLISSDPFLSVKSLGATIGYHLSEDFSLNVVGWKHSVQDSDAMDRLQKDITIGVPSSANTNEPKWFLGSELAYSPLYGKLSLAGSAIIYYDAHLLGGVGMTNTETGKYVTPFIGVGQQIYLSQSVAIRLDYRLMHYKEKIPEKIKSGSVGDIIGERSNWTNSITLGVSFLIGG